MSLSVVIPSYNQCGQVTACLDALSTLEIDTEIIVVNGPSTDGTSGVVRERDDVDCLLECSSRNLNVARNAGLSEASEHFVALLSPRYRVTEKWAHAIQETLAGGVDAASGPATPSSEDETKGIEDTPNADGLAINGGNLALTRGAITALDGFDEYLDLGGARDLGQRLRGTGLQFVWHPGMRVEPVSDDIELPPVHAAVPPAGWQDHRDPGWGVIYRSRSYLRVKNQGIRPAVIGGIAMIALRDGATAASEVIDGNASPSAWFGNGSRVLKNVIIGMKKGRTARRADRTTARNPHGLSRSRDEKIADRVDHRGVSKS